MRLVDCTAYDFHRVYCSEIMLANHKMRVVIIGNGVTSNMTALYLRKRLPETAEITLIGPRDRGGMPVVGESTIEITAQFLEKLGLKSYLRDHHHPKYGLTYYFKLRPGEPEDRRYSVQCNERDPVDLDPVEGWPGPMARPPSWQLNRFVFDRDMRKKVDETPNIRRQIGVVKDVSLNSQGHTLTCRDEAGEALELEADWIVDTTGRKQFLGRKLKLIEKSELQRSAFWFRVTGFDPEILRKIEAYGPMPAAEGEPYHHDRYFTTHHFMGRGNWVWMIPLRHPEGKTMMSIGLSMRPDIYPHKIRKLEDFMTHVGQEHPVITELVSSGTVEDSNVYHNYRHESKQIYSEDRWAVVGEAAVSVDPLFSNGLAFGCLQIEQVGEMIARDMAGDHSPKYIRKLEKCWWAPVRNSQLSIAHWYEEMHDPILSAVRLHMIEVSYFYILLPLVINRCHYDPKWMKLWRILQLSSGPTNVPVKVAKLRESITEIKPEHFVYHGKEKVNLQALKRYDSPKELQKSILAAVKILDRYFEEIAACLEQPASAD